MRIEIGLYSGVLFGMRSFSKDESYPYTETHFYIPFIYIAFINSETV
jgi:hypothetical protein